jgi:hypothetical protein
MAFGILIGFLSSNSEAVVNAETALNSNYYFSHKMAENQTESKLFMKIILKK